MTHAAQSSEGKPRFPSPRPKKRPVGQRPEAVPPPCSNGLPVSQRDEQARASPGGELHRAAALPLGFKGGGITPASCRGGASLKIMNWIMHPAASLQKRWKASRDLPREGGTFSEQTRKMLPEGRTLVLRSREDKEMKECDTGPKPAKTTSRSLRTGFPMDLVLTVFIRAPPHEKQLPRASCLEGDRWTSSAKEGLLPRAQRAKRGLRIPGDSLPRGQGERHPVGRPGETPRQGDGMGWKCSSPSLLPLSPLWVSREQGQCHNSQPRKSNGRAHVSLAAPFRPLQSTYLGCRDGGAAPEPNLQVGSQSSWRARGQSPSPHRGESLMARSLSPFPLGRLCPSCLVKKPPWGSASPPPFRARQLAGCHSVTFTSLVGSEPEGRP